MCAPGVIGDFVVTRPVAPSNVVPTASAALAATPPTPLMLTGSPFGAVAKSPVWRDQAAARAPRRRAAGRVDLGDERVVVLAADVLGELLGEEAVVERDAVRPGRHVHADLQHGDVLVGVAVQRAVVVGVAEQALAGRCRSSFGRSTIRTSPVLRMP